MGVTQFPPRPHRVGAESPRKRPDAERSGWLERLLAQFELQYAVSRRHDRPP